MIFNLTVNEGDSAPSPTTPGVFNVRSFYNETDAGHVSGPFATREAAETFATALAVRSDVIKVTIEEGV